MMTGTRVLTFSIGLVAVAALAVSCANTTDNCEQLSTCEAGGAGGKSGANKGGTAGIAIGGTATNDGGFAGLVSSAGSSVVAGAAGTTAQLPCHGACKGSTPYCDESSQICVACLKDANCTGATPACDPETNVCVACITDQHCPSGLPACTSKKICAQCTANTHCSGTTPVCDTDTNVCVECLSSANCTGASKPQCNEDKKICVECLSNADCKTATASLCNTTTNTCSPCSADADCTQITGTNVCLTDVTGQPNQCVQCTAANETACGANSCNPKTSACTATPRGSVDICRACLADSECIGGNIASSTARCVPMTFKGAAHGAGGYCLQRTGAGCSQPYSVSVSAISLSGAVSESYCGVNQAATTCEAVLDLVAAKTCAVDSECGGDRGGLCKPISIVAPANRCTIPCISAAECLQAPAPGSVCSPPTTPYCH